VIAKNDPWCRGIVLLGLEAPQDELAKAFDAVAGQRLVKGFAVGRTIFNSAAQQWLTGHMSDVAATADMAERFGNLVELWNGAKRS
jgi:5-dehydro-2-deoxygluconokinase